MQLSTTCSVVLMLDSFALLKVVLGRPTEALAWQMARGSGKWSIRKVAKWKDETNPMKFGTFGCNVGSGCEG
jgi:hypothetical protein